MTRALFIFAVVVFPQGLSWGQQYNISTFAGGAPPVTPAQATATSIGDPPRVAVDGSGNVYFAALHSVFKVDSAGTLTRIAGNGRSGYSGDNGPATSAQLAYPDGLAVDAAGNIYVSDRAVHVIRRISAGTITTIAGNGSAGYSGDNGPAASAQFNVPDGLAIDASGNLFVADSNNHCIRMISGGTITTVAGSGTPGSDGDGGPAAFALLNTPEGVAVDSAGNLYIADTFNNRIRKVTGDGSIDTIAGTGRPGTTGDNGPAANATMFFPSDVEVGTTGVVYIADLGSSRIRMVDLAGNMSTIAGGTAETVLSDGDPGISVRLNGPTGLAVDSAGNVYFVEGSIGSGSGLTSGDFRVWKLGTDGFLNVIAGDGQESYSGDGGPAAIAQVNAPAGMAVDSKGNVYFADTDNNRIRMISRNGTVTTVAGFGEAGYAGDGERATAALLNHPMGVAVDAYGDIFIADTGNSRIRQIDVTGTITTVAGNGNAGLFGDGGDALHAAIHAPRSVAVDPAGNLYIADTLDNRIRIVTTDGIINTFAGKGKGFGGDGGAAVDALFNFPSSVALDGSGNVYVADQGNSRVRKISTSGTITTVAGADNGLPGDGIQATSAQLGSPQGVAVDQAGNLYISDGSLNLVRKVVNGVITTIAGTGLCCYYNDGGPATKAGLNSPWGLGVDTAGNVYVADSSNNAIRLLTPVAGQ